MSRIFRVRLAALPLRYGPCGFAGTVTTVASRGGRCVAGDHDHRPAGRVVDGFRRTRAILALPLLLHAFAAGHRELDTLRRGFSGVLDGLVLTFGLAGVLVWALWLESLRHGLPEPVARIFHDTQPGFQPPVHWLPLAVAIFLSLLWVALVRPAHRSNRRAVLNWAAG